MLRPVDSNQYQAQEHQAVYGTINAGQSFIFGDRDLFTLVAPSSPGSYTSRWRMWVAGAWVGPEISIPFSVGSAPPPPPRPSGWRVQYWNGYYNQNPWGNGPCKMMITQTAFHSPKIGGHLAPAGDVRPAYLVCYSSALSR
ncbi:MAG: hypothetical protein HC853_08570 [Anaerolineae bacterium]|nr:hypothetical protein [Anaerolineae bacterium]